MTKESILTFLKENHSLLESKFSVEKIGLFGSYAKGTATSKSDIDLYVVFKKKTFDNLAGLWVYLEDFFHKKVDIVHRHPYSNDVILKRIEKDVIYG